MRLQKKAFLSFHLRYNILGGVDRMIDLQTPIKGKGIRIVFTEGYDTRVMLAACKLKEDELLQPILYGERNKLISMAETLHLNLEGIELLDPNEFQEKEKMMLRMLELRKGKADRSTVETWINLPAYFCTMYVEMGYADGLLGGASTSTADTLRPIMQLVKTSLGNSIVSSCFMMNKEDESYLFADCSLNIKPNVDELVEIALQTAQTAKSFHMKPSIAMLCYSTYGSGRGEDIDKMKEASLRLKNMPLDYEVDGEMQADCALNATVARMKAPTSVVGGHANVLVFPDLNAGNIGYKLVANLGHFEALGPILQGVRLPMNDLSRGATWQEIYKMALITALQKHHMMQ